MSQDMHVYIQISAVMLAWRHTIVYYMLFYYYY
jgi:hypothetical protein